MLEIKIEPAVILLITGIIFSLTGDITIPFIFSFIYIAGKLERSTRLTRLKSKVQRCFNRVIPY